MFTTSQTEITDRRRNVWQATAAPDQTKVRTKNLRQVGDWVNTMLPVGGVTVGRRMDWELRTLSLGEMSVWIWPTNLEQEQRETYSDNAIDLANEARLLLLARQYARQRLIPEERARLAIVTERVRQLVPSVTKEEVESLDEVMNRLREIEASNNAVLEKLAIKKLE